MATLQKFKLLDEQEQQYKRTGKIDKAAIYNAGITQLDYQQYEASKQELQKTGQVDFSRYTSDPNRGIYGGMDTNQLDKDALNLVRTAWKDKYSSSADKGFAYDMTDPEDYQNMLSGRMSKAASSAYDVDEMSQWLYREGLPNSQYFGAYYNTALEEVQNYRRMAENDKALDERVQAALMEKANAGALIDEITVAETLAEIRQLDAQSYDELDKVLYKDAGGVTSKTAQYLAAHQEVIGSLAPKEEPQKQLFTAGEMWIPQRDRVSEPEAADPELSPRAEEAAAILAPFALPRFEPSSREYVRASENPELHAELAAQREADKQAYAANVEFLSNGAYNALIESGFSDYEAAAFMDMNGIPFFGTTKHAEAEAVRRANQSEGLAYLNQRAVEDGMENAATFLHSYIAPIDRGEWSDAQTEAIYSWTLGMRQELIEQGYTPLEADNIIAVSDLGEALDKRQTAEDYERHMLSLYGLDELAINDYISTLTDEDWEQRIKDLKFNDTIETGSFEQAERTLYSIPVRAALGIATGVVGVADMALNGLEALATGQEQDMWKSTKYLLDQSGRWAAYGRDINHPVMSAASDIGSEILRMYALGAAGKALGGLTAAGTSTLLTTAASQTPFVASAMGSYYTQARMTGANQAEATLYGVIGGTVEGLLEGAAMSEILEQAFTNKIMTKAITNAATPLKTRMLLAKYGTPLANILASTIGEFGEEAASEVVSGLLRTALWEPAHETTLADVGESGAMGAAIGFIMSALGAPATSRRNQMVMQMMAMQSGAMPMDLQMFGGMYDDLVAATIAETLKPETLSLMQKDAALQSAPMVADMIAQIQHDNAHISAEMGRHKKRLEALTADVEKSRSKVNRYVVAFKALDPNSSDYAKRWGELRGQIDSARDNLEQITASTVSKREAASTEHAALISRLQNDVARTSDKLTRHFVARDAAAQAEAEAIREAENTGVDGFGNPIQYELPDGGSVGRDNAGGNQTPPSETGGGSTAGDPGGIQDLGANTPDDQGAPVEYAVSPQFRETATGLRRLGRRGYRAFVDGSAELGNVTKAQKQAQSGTATVDAMAQIYRNAGGTVDYMLDVEQVDAYGNPTGQKSYRELWESYPDVDGETANLYLLHRHNIDRMAQEKPIFANEDGTPVTAEQSREIIKQMAQENPDLPQLANEVRQWHNRFMRDFVVGDLLSESDFANLLNMYPDYVPTFRKEYEDKPRGTSSSRGTTVSINQPIRTAKGATSDVRDVRDSFADGYNAMVRARRKNDLLLNLYQFALDHPSAAAPYAQIVGNPVQDSAMPVYDDIMAEAFLEARDGDYIVRARKNGEWVEMGVSKDVFDSINDLFNRQYNEFTEDAMGIGRKITGWQKALITGYNPFFAVRNLARDTQTALFNDESMNPIKFVDSLAKSAKMMAENSPEFQKFKALGGDRSGFFKSNEGFVRSAKFDTPDTLGKKALNKLGDITAAGGEYTETLNRFATAIRYIDKHGSTDADWQQAMLASAEGTTNFSRSGPLAKAADSWLIYLNANIQGTDKVLRQVKNHPASTLSKTAGVALAASLLGHLAGNDENEHYHNLSWRVKDNYFCIPNVFGERDSLGYPTTFIRIPKAQGYAAIIAAFQRAATMVTQDKDFIEAYDGFIDSAQEALSITPSTPVSALIEASRNESWSGATIEPAYMGDRPVAERYDSSTSSIAVNLGKVLAGMGASPKKIDYVLDQWTGVAGDIVLPATAIGNDSAESAAKSVGDVLARQFVADPLFSNDIVSNFYEAGADIEIERRQAYDARTAAMQGDEFKGRAELKFTAYNKAKGELSESYKRERDILAKHPNSKDRDQWIKDERRKRLRIIQTFNERWGE